MEESLWAKMETRVRRLVFDLLEPSINRVAEHKDMLENLRRTDESLSRKIDTMDILTDKLNKRLAIVDDFSRKILQFDATIHVQETVFAQDRESMRNELETFLKQLTSAEENISNLIGQSQSLRTDLVNFTFETNNSKQLINSRIEEVRSELKAEILDLENKHKGLNNYSGALEKKFNLFLQDFEIVDVIAKKAEHSAEDNMSQLKIIFKNFAGFKKEAKDGIEKVRGMAMQFSQTLNEQMKGLKERFSMEFPVQTQLIVSENLHSVLELKERKVLAEFEQEKFAEWDVMLSGNSFEDKIQTAKLRAREVIARPLPKPKLERIIELQQPAIASPKVKKNKTKKKKKDKKEDQMSRTEFKIQVENIEEEKVFIEQKNSIDIIEDETKEVNVFDSEKSEKVNNSGKIEEVDDRPNEVKPETERIVQVAKPFDVDDIKKNSLTIMKILGIKDISEELSLINDSIKKLQDDLVASVKRLQQTNSSTDEKIQMLVKKQFETVQKIEDLKTSQQNQSLKSESDKKELQDADTQILEKLSRETLEIKTNFSTLNSKFGILDKETQSRLNTLIESFEKLNKTTEKSLNTQEKTLQIFYDDISKSNQILDLQIQQAALECNAAVTQRKRDHHDNQAEFRKIQGIFESFNKKNDKVNQNIENFSRTVTLLIEFSKIVTVLMQQDEVDRESIALFGVKDMKNSKFKSPVMIDKQCISCSGQPNFITNAFKLACLAYSPTLVMFKDTVYERYEMIEILKKIVDGVGEDTVSDFSNLPEMQKLSISAKPTHFRPASRNSNLSFSQSVASATPDLPPLSFQKRLN